MITPALRTRNRLLYTSLYVITFSAVGPVIVRQEMDNLSQSIYYANRPHPHRISWSNSAEFFIPAYDVSVVVMLGAVWMRDSQWRGKRNRWKTLFHKDISKQSQYNAIKGRFHPKVQVLSSFIRLRVVPNQSWKFLPSAWHKRRNLAEWPHCLKWKWRE